MTELMSRDYDKEDYEDDELSMNKLYKQNHQKVTFALLKRIVPLKRHLQYVRQQYKRTSFTSQKSFDKNFLDFRAEDPSAMALYNKQISLDITSLMNVDDRININESNKKLVLRQGSDLSHSNENFEKRRNSIVEEQQFNQNFILKRAILKETNPELIKKIEAEYFFDNYGAFFQQIQDINLTPILKHQSFLLDLLRRMLRFNTINSNVFLNGLEILEKQVSEILLPKSSFFKFVFQDNYNNWFTLYHDKDQFKMIIMDKCLFSYQEQVWDIEDEIYVCRDFFQKENSLVNETLENIYDKMKMLSFIINDNTDLFLLPMETSIL